MTRAPSASFAEGGADAGPAGERAVLVTVALAALLVPLNSTMIAVALPRLVDDLGTSLTSASWLVTSYLIAMAALQPVRGQARRPLRPPAARAGRPGLVRRRVGGSGGRRQPRAAHRLPRAAGRRRRAVLPQLDGAPARDRAAGAPRLADGPGRRRAAAGRRRRPAARRRARRAGRLGVDLPRQPAARRGRAPRRPPGDPGRRAGSGARRRLRPHRRGAADGDAGGGRVGPQRQRPRRRRRLRASAPPAWRCSSASSAWSCGGPTRWSSRGSSPARRSARRRPASPSATSRCTCSLLALPVLLDRQGRPRRGRRGAGAGLHVGGLARRHAARGTPGRPDRQPGAGGRRPGLQALSLVPLALGPGDVGPRGHGRVHAARGHRPGAGLLGPAGGGGGRGRRAAPPAWPLACSRRAATPGASWAPRCWRGRWPPTRPAPEASASSSPSWPSPRRRRPRARRSCPASGGRAAVAPPSGAAAAPAHA